MKKGPFSPMLLMAAVFLTAVPVGHAENNGENIAYATRGAGKILSGLFAIPSAMLQGAGRSFPLGIVTGAVQGTFQTVSGVVGGAVDVARGAAPYAKYAAIAAA